MKVKVRSAVSSAGAAAALAFAALASMACAQPPPTPPLANDNRTPRGDTVDPAHAAATVQSLCTKCHDLGLVTSAKYDREGWQEVLQRMYGHGLVASDEEAKEVLDYLATNPSPAR